MVKVVFLVKRREGVTHEQLIAHWQDPHIPAVRESVMPDHYRVTFFEPGDHVPYDGMAIFWFLRLLVQFFGYSSELWRGKRRETIIHRVFAMVWLYLALLFLVVALSGRAAAP